MKSKLYLLIIILLISFSLSSCDSQVAHNNNKHFVGTWYEWSFLDDEASKLVVLDDGKCVFTDSGEKYPGEYSISEKTLYVFLDNGYELEFQLYDDGHISPLGSENVSRWYSQKDVAQEAWQQVLEKNETSLTEGTYFYYNDILGTIEYLRFSNLKNNHTADYKVYTLKHPSNPEPTIAKELWEEGKLTELESGQVEFDSHGIYGTISGIGVSEDSDTFANLRYPIDRTAYDSVATISSLGIVEENDYTTYWINLK